MGLLAAGFKGLEEVLDEAFKAACGRVAPSSTAERDRDRHASIEVRCVGPAVGKG